MTMPEASVDENDGAVPRECEIRTTREFLRVEPEPKPQSMRNRTNDKLRLGVRASNS